MHLTDIRPRVRNTHTALLKHGRKDDPVRQESRRSLEVLASLQITACLTGYAGLRFLDWPTFKAAYHLPGNAPASRREAGAAIGNSLHCCATRRPEDHKAVDDPAMVSIATIAPS